MQYCAAHTNKDLFSDSRALPEMRSQCRAAETCSGRRHLDGLLGRDAIAHVKAEPVPDAVEPAEDPQAAPFHGLNRGHLPVLAAGLPFRVW
eukprot:scaffold63252_cov46-Prasinocladus_malaysianus.AAC.4